MLGLSGDFTGFTFSGVHSSELGITHVSDGDRYKDSLVPEIEDKTVEIPGLDGAYFYGSNFKTRSIPLSIAFDEVTEDQIREMRQLFGYKHTGELIFDEMPYKKYLVKVASPPELEYVCFDERRKIASENAEEGIRTIRNLSETVTIPALEDEVTLYGYLLHEQPTQKPVAVVDGEEIEYTYNANTNECIFEKEEEPVIVDIIYNMKEKIYPYKLSETAERIYKGEGSIEFIAYYPFAKQVAKVRSAFEELGYSNIDEWWNTSGLLDSYAGIDVYSADAINVYNPGDVETGFRLVIPFNTTTVDENTIYSLPGFTIKYIHVNDNIEETLATLNVQEITRDNDDVSTAIQVNTMNGLIEGVYKDTNVSILPEDINGSLITSGTIFNEYATGEFFKLLPCKENEYKIKITGLKNETPVIYYDYLYF